MAQSSPIQRKITIAVVGMGNRGQVYSEFAHEHPELCELVALAEPRPAVRVYYAKYHNVPAQNVFSDWRELAAQDRLSDAVIIATQDKMHAEPAIAFGVFSVSSIERKERASEACLSKWLATSFLTGVFCS
jgi:pimeloyl-ACP methyl ester carboxylesterase